VSPRRIAAAFDAIVMVAIAFQLTGGSFARARADLVIWGSAAAAVVAAIVVLANGPAAIGWIAVGYVLFAAFFAEPPALLLVLLAVAFMPLLPRPRGSLLAGIGLAVVAAVLIRVIAVGLI
jgi:hypothetical protein